MSNDPPPRVEAAIAEFQAAAIDADVEFVGEDHEYVPDSPRLQAQIEERTLEDKCRELVEQWRNKDDRSGHKSPSPIVVGELECADELEQLLDDHSHPEGER